MTAEPLPSLDFDRLHPDAIRSAPSIRDLLLAARRAGVELHRGMNRRVLPERARIVTVDDQALELAIENFDACKGDVFLNFELDGVGYFMSSRALEEPSDGTLRVALPHALYVVERRGRERRAWVDEAGGVARMQLSIGDRRTEAFVADVSAGGLGLDVPATAARWVRPGSEMRLTAARGGPASEPVTGVARHQSASGRGPEWVRLGVATSFSGPKQAVAVERRRAIVTRSWLERVGQGVRTAASMVEIGRRAAWKRLAPERRDDLGVDIVDFESRRGEKLRGILDSWGDPSRATAVVIPPAWGRTKETLMPLAETIVATFRRAGRPVAVLRFDGIRKRGESHNDPECGGEGDEHLRFTFSQGVRDIEAALDYFDRTASAPRRTILVTFSAASVDGRRAVALESGRRIHGWVSVVGSGDLQSMMHVISGGVDFLGGLERGTRFGRQEILGVTVDMDHAGLDALRENIAFIEDSRRDLAGIDVPITWIHGEHDAWMDFERVRDVLACGDTSRRKLLVVPTGHQLKSSREALETFQLIASEAGRMALGESLVPGWPNIARLEQKRLAERRRLPKSKVDLRAFWKGYLVGRDGRLGIELMTSASAYRSLMGRQIEALGLEGGERVADLGAGAGAFPLALHRTGLPRPVRVDEIDFVTEGLRRGRERWREAATGSSHRVTHVAADLASPRVAAAVPVRDATYDAVLASLLIGYLPSPQRFLEECRRILRPGGRLVLSNLREDADISRIYRDGSEELLAGLGSDLPDVAPEELRASLRSFLNDAARLGDLEETGRFRFVARRELAAMLEAAGFRTIRGEEVFGSPPQAFLLVGSTPS